VELAGLYWHFVDVVWIFLFYLVNRSRGWFTAPGGSTAAGAIVSLSGPPEPVPPVEPAQNTSPK
jgi:hypothetical protein